jgi:hypothetical protein
MMTCVHIRHRRRLAPAQHSSRHRTRHRQVHEPLTNLKPHRAGLPRAVATSGSERGGTHAGLARRAGKNPWNFSSGRCERRREFIANDTPIQVGRLPEPAREANGRCPTAGGSNGSDPRASHSTTTWPVTHSATAVWTPQWRTTARSTEPSDGVAAGSAIDREHSSLALRRPLTSVGDHAARRRRRRLLSLGRVTFPSNHERIAVGANSRGAT